MTSQTPQLFTPLTIRDVTLRNRVVVSPMCQYSSREGLADAWHLVHLGSRAAGGAGLVFVEATAVTPDGRISPADMGLWSDAHTAALAPIAAFIRRMGAVPGIQLAHAGRKASCLPPWAGGAKIVSQEGGGWPCLAPSPLPFAPDEPAPRALDAAGIEAVKEAFVQAARRAVAAGFAVIELHAAHGYLLHQFLSPLSNLRDDAYGGDLPGRMRLTLETASAIREVIPGGMPLFTRISATDWKDGGWDLEQSVALSRELAARGVDLIDVSTGALVPDAVIPVAPGYQIPFAAAVRERVGILTSAVGLITEPAQAEAVVASGQADLVQLARAMLRDPYWTLHAAQTLGVTPDWPQPYGYAVRRHGEKRG
jgi:2,4-dienoyl-CoA reductase (NADPH2)